MNEDKKTMLDSVNFKLAKLLKEKGFNQPCRLCVTNDDHKALPFNAGNGLHVNSKDSYYSAPSVAEVLVWLYEVHKLWIIVAPTVDCYFNWKVLDIQRDPQNEIERPEFKEVNHSEYTNPFKALEAAIECCLNNII